MPTFTPESLVTAVKKLFELNHYRVTGPQNIHGAEVDLIASPIADPFGRYIYIEVTVEYVDNEKYGKDVGKLAMLGEIDRDAHRLIVSSAGFSLPVQERAKATRIETLTYDDLFRKFEKFEPYIAAYSSQTEAGKEVAALAQVYEPPQFEDSLGNEFAVDFLTAWKDSAAPDNRWIVITGEYGTGKTALTRVLHYQWLEAFKANPSLPIPFRIELRSFVRQFDARGLLHHFLDRNRLSHISGDFVESLVRSGRVVLLLDGYDEMAQYFNSRERRQCLEALATLSSEGARGIITSRPNYFTLSEELQVFEALYSSIKSTHHLNASALAFFDRESEVDRLLEKFLDRFERHLRDLTPDQTNALVERILGDDPHGLTTIKQILTKIFRNQEGDSIALSGKPVIVSYLLEVVEQLKRLPPGSQGNDVQLGEWQVYKLIVDQLMLRDLERSPDITPDARRHFLQRLALFLSKRENEVIREDDFKDLVSSEFRRDLNRHSGDAKIEALSRYFSDLRSSATLTRSVSESGEGWRFSHNSIREFLIAEYIASRLRAGHFVNDRVPISDAMRTFAAAISNEEVARILSSLQNAWRSVDFDGVGKGQALCLFWGAFLGKSMEDDDQTRSLLSKFASIGEGLKEVSLNRLDLSSEARPADLAGMSFRGANFSFIQLDFANLAGADFSGSVLDSVSLSNATLTNTNLSNSLLVDTSLVGANLSSAQCVGISPDSTSLIVESNEWPHSKQIEGQYAIGYLRYKGALTDPVADYFVFAHHPRFEIVDKIVTNLSKQAQRQRRGLEQRGAANADVPFARAFVSHLINKNLIYVPRNRKDIVEPTEHGREVFQAFVDGQTLTPELIEFLQSN
jgi:uncharacterized protein YjbI with pentapeptide repeats/Cdc6-like AAA superfamily ATPase